MGTESSYSWGARIGVVAVGAALAFAGLVAREVAAETSSLEFRNLQGPDGSLQSDATDGQYEIEDTTDGSAAVLLVQEDRRSEVFVGAPDEAAFWIESGGTEPAVSGTRTEVDDWIAQQESAEDDPRWPLALMISGVVLMLAGLAVGWRKATID